MAGLRPLCSELPRVEPYVSVHLADLDDGKKFLGGAIRRPTENSKLPPMRLRYGHIMVENQLPNADFKKQGVLDCSPGVEADVVGGEEDANGDRVFEIYFSQYNRNYLVTLAFRPEERSENDDDDEDSSHQEEEENQLGNDYYNNDEDYSHEEEEGSQLGSDYYRYDEDYSHQEEEEYQLGGDYCSDDDEEEETYEVERDQQIGYDQELTGKRTFVLYFQGHLHYVVRFVFDKVEEARFLEQEVEFLFNGLQRVVGISYDGSKEDQEDAIPAIIDDKSSCALPELVESEISRKLMEAKIGESDEIKTTEDGESLSRIIENPILETEKGSENEIGAESADPSSGNFVDLDHLNLLERKNHLIAQIVRDHLQLHSPV